jgi:hypothetical protein
VAIFPTQHAFAESQERRSAEISSDNTLFHVFPFLYELELSICPSQFVLRFSPKFSNSRNLITLRAAGISWQFDVSGNSSSHCSVLGLLAACGTSSTIAFAILVFQSGLSIDGTSTHLLLHSVPSFWQWLPIITAISQTSMCIP